MASRTVSIVLTAQVQNYLSNVKAAEDATRQLDARTKTMTESLRAQQTQLQKHHQALTQFGVGMGAVGAVAAAGLVVAIRASTEFGAKMAQLQSLSHASASTMKLLADAAMSAGTAYGFSASQVADAEIELVKAGVSVEAQLGGALKGALTLAAAGQMDVAAATEITTVAMTQFGLSAKQVPHLADLLAAGADKALGSVGDLGEALKNGGLQAHNMGLSIDDTIGTLSAFANAGILGAEAGTQLRSMFLRLQNPTAASKHAMAEYGIAVNDASGKFIGISKFADELHDKLGNLSQAQRNQALATMFGSHAIVGATVLYQDGGKAADKAGGSIRDWIKAVNDAGFASAQAAGKMNSLQGDLQKFGAAGQTALIKFGSAGTGPLRDLTQGATAATTALGNMDPAVQGGVVVAAALVAGVGLLGGAFLLAVPKVVLFRDAMRDLNITGGQLGRTLGKGGVILAGVTDIVSAFGALGEHGTASTQQISAAAVTISNSWAGLNKVFGSAGSTLTSGRGLKASLDELGDGSAFSSAGSAKIFDGLTFGIAHLSDVYKSNEANLDAMGQQLAGLSEHDYGKAAESFTGLVQKYKLSGSEISTLLNNMPAYREELTKQAAAAHVSASDQNLLLIAQGKGAAGAKVLASAQLNAAVAATEQAQTLASLSGQASTATMNIDALQKQIEGFGSAQLDARSATRAMYQAIDDATAAVGKNGATLDVHTQKGRDNQAALDGIATAADNATSKTLKQTGDTAKAAAVMQQGRDAYIKAAEAMGLGAGKAKALADQLGLIPSNVYVAVKLNRYDEAKAQLKDLETRLAGLHGKTLTVTVAAQIDMTNSQIRVAEMAASGTDYFGNPVKRAGGGQIDGRGPKGIDSVPALLAPNEHVWTSGEVDAAGGHGAVYRIRAAARAGALSGFAVGGAASQRQQDREDFISAQRRAYGHPVDPLGYVDELRTMSRSTDYSAASRHRFDAASNRYESSLVKLALASEKASTRLGDLQASAAQLRSAVSSSITGRYSLSGASAAGPEHASGWVNRDGMRFQTYTAGGPTAASIASYYTHGAATEGTFAKNLKTLASRGLTAGLLTQLAQEQDGPSIAATLLSASGSQIKAINSGYGGIASAAGRSAGIVTDDSYAKQIRAAERNADRITAQLRNDGEKLRKLIAQAFGLRGYASGTDSATPGVHLVGEHGPELVGFHGGEWVANAQDTGRWIRGGGGGGGGGRTLRVEVALPTSMDLIDAGGGLITTVGVVARQVAVQEIHADALSDAVYLAGGAA